MNKRLKKFLTIFIAIVLAGGAITYGALTAPRPAAERPQVLKAPILTEKQLEDRLADEQLLINGALLDAYPQVSTDYTLGRGKLYDQGQWYGAILTYKGTDAANRDTLRVLAQKKDGIWVFRTKPPVPLLSVKSYPDVPKPILQAVNQAVSLP